MGHRLETIFDFVVIASFFLAGQFLASFKFSIASIFLYAVYDVYG